MARRELVPAVVGVAIAVAWGFGVAFGAPALGLPHGLVMALIVSAPVVGGAVLAWCAAQPLALMLRAVRDGLLSFSEGDFSFRVAADGGITGDVGRRFNAFGAAMRAVRDTTYQREMMHEMLLDAAALAVVLCDDGGSVVFATAQARELLANGRCLQGASFDDVLSQCRAELREALSLPNDVIFTVERSDGQHVYHASRRFFDVHGSRHTLYIIKSLTRELVRQEVEVWKKAIRVIGHELNNSLAPITSLVHSARSLATRPDASARLDAVFGVIEERTQHLRGFLEEYARFAKLPPPSKQWVGWDGFLEGLRGLYAFERLGNVAAGNGYFDPAQMQQVAINLLKNAVESGSPAADIGVGVAATGDGWELEVVDRGSGLTAAVMAKALLPFYSTKQTGAGLGLALCREVLEAHGGTLALETREGGGARVRCWLPAPANAE